MNTRALMGLLTVALFFSVMPFLPATVADESVTGKFNIGNGAPQITSAVLMINGTQTSTVTPNISYSVTIHIYDPNTINDISRLYVVFNYTGGPWYHNGVFTAEYMWDADNGWNLMWPIGTTFWRLDFGYAPSGGSITGTWVLNFTASPFARAGLWYIYIRVEDKANAADTYIINFTMTKYTEIFVNASWFSFGSVSLGGYSPIKIVNGISQDHIPVIILANHAVNMTLSSSQEWTAGDGAAHVVVGYPSSPGTISLYANVSGQYHNAGWIRPSPYKTSMYVSDPPSSEDIVVVNIFITLHVASEGLPAGEYTGTLYIGII